MRKTRWHKKKRLRGGRLLFTHSRINQSTALIPASITAASTYASNCLTFSSKRVRRSEAVLSYPTLSRQLLRGWSTSGDTPWQLSGMRGQNVAPASLARRSVYQPVRREPWRGMKGVPKHAEKVAWGSFPSPFSVPATHAVWPDRK